jgi:hypothetical protein
VSSDQARERFRVEHQVRLVLDAEEGAGFSHLPAGVYGFTYAPATETPLFKRHSYHSFEVHKLPGGAGRLIAFCTPEVAEELKGTGKEIEATLYPDPWEKATVPVAIPFDWIFANLYKPVRRDGNAIDIRISTPA